tara:strand:- start:9298 stop:9678 length:381 start_codon:yes stop_codon:yes gene_type:complete
VVRRFFIFFFGVLLGVMVIRFAFPGRFVEYAQYFDLDYRVLYHLKSDTIYISADAQCHLDCLSIDQKDVLNVLEGGNVNFVKSDQYTGRCKYYLVEKESLSVGFDLCDEKVILKNFSINQDSCFCY